MRDIGENETHGGMVSGQWKIPGPAFGCQNIGVEKSIGTSDSKTAIHGYISMSRGPCRHSRPIGIESLLYASHVRTRGIVAHKGHYSYKARPCLYITIVV